MPPLQHLPPPPTSFGAHVSGQAKPAQSIRLSNRVVWLHTAQCLVQLGTWRSLEIRPRFRVQTIVNWSAAVWCTEGEPARPWFTEQLVGRHSMEDTRWRPITMVDCALGSCEGCTEPCGHDELRLAEPSGAKLQLRTGGDFCGARYVAWRCSRCSLAHVITGRLWPHEQRCGPKMVVGCLLDGCRRPGGTAGTPHIDNRWFPRGSEVHLTVLYPRDTRATSHRATGGDHRPTALDPVNSILQI